MLRLIFGKLDAGGAGGTLVPGAFRAADLRKTLD